MNYRIRWTGCPKPWSLYYRWDDQRGEGWSQCACHRFRWPLRIYARWHKWRYDRDIAKLMVREDFEL